MDTLSHNDAWKRAKIEKFIEELRSRRDFDYNYFNDIYKTCVARKRRKILEAIKETDDSHADLLNEPRPAGEARQKRMVLYTYYLYLEDDGAYRQKAFAEFLKKRMEEIDNKACDECWGMHAHLEGLYEHSSYWVYQGYTEFNEKLWVYQRHLWEEFFENSEECFDIIPSERPPVLYTGKNTDIPRFIFEPPYTGTYSEQEFHARFMKEWHLTHYNPYLDENLRGHFIDIDPYRNELGDKPEKAYRDYQNAVAMFRKIHSIPRFCNQEW